MTLIYLTLAWLLGIIIGKSTDLAPIMLALLGAAGLILLLVMRTRKYRLLALLALFVVLGAWRLAIAQPRLDAQTLAYYNDTAKVTVRGYISAPPSVRGTYTQLEVSAQSLILVDGEHEVRGKVVLNTSLYPAYAYGDRLQITGTLETPPVLEGFDYREYLAARNVHSVIYRPQITRLVGKDGSILLRLVYRARSSLHGTITSVLPDPDAGLLSGVLLGENHTLPDYLEDAFRRTGLTHIVVISGYNISLVIQVVMLFARHLFKRRTALLACLAAITLYMVFVGPSPPVVRATVMGGLFAIAQLVGRRGHAPTSLAATCLLMTAVNPRLIWSVSFQLSFASTLGLLLLEPQFERNLVGYLDRSLGSVRAAQWLSVLRDVLLASLAAQLATLPIIWYHFGEVSLVSLLANALVLPVQPVIMVLGAGAALLGSLWPALGQVAGWLVWPWTRYTILVVEWLSAMPLASVQVPALPEWLIWAVYAFLGLWVWGVSETKSAVRQAASQAKQRYTWLLLGLTAVLVLCAVLALPDGKLHIYCLDIGQGDAILLRTPHGRTMLIDGGSDPTTLASRLGQILPFWQRQLDVVVATHADLDHLGGLVPLLERYRISRAIESPTMDACPLVDEWHRGLAAQGVQPIAGEQGLYFELDGVQIRGLSPPSRMIPAGEIDDNRNSVTLLVTMEAFSLLLTADIDSEVEQHLVASGALEPVTLLKVAHHGSGTGTSEAFLSAVRPQVAVISVGADNRFGHPAECVLERLDASGARVLRTDVEGTIEVVTDGRSVWINP